MEDRSHKIKKTRNTKDGERNHICGCSKAYKSYPALYLHIQRKHEGIRPENTITMETAIKKKPEKTHTGRPSRPENDIDDILPSEEALENAENELMLFLGDEINAIFAMNSKREPKAVYEDLLKSLQGISRDICDYYDDSMDKFVRSLDTEEEIVLNEHLKKPNNSENMKTTLSLIVLWFGRYYLETKMLTDVAILFYKMQEFIESQDIKFGTEKGFKMLEVRENVQKLSGDLRKIFVNDWKANIPKAIKLFNHFLSCIVFK